MKIHIISLFPESFGSYFGSSIMKKAQDLGVLELQFYHLCDYSIRPTKRVDRKAFGMHGQVLEPEPIAGVIEEIWKKQGKKLPVIYLSPSGKLLTQATVEENYKKYQEDCIVLCGHYEGVDQRIIDLYVSEVFCIGEYVLSSGELAAMVFIDSMVRLIPGVLGNHQSHEEESFSQKFNRQKEHPVYTRPQVFQGLEVPEVLLSGNHKKIEEWKLHHLR